MLVHRVECVQLAGEWVCVPPLWWSVGLTGALLTGVLVLLLYTENPAEERS